MAGRHLAEEVLANSEEPPRLSQDELNIVNKIRSNPFRWNGQFSPQLVEAHLKAYSSFDSFVWDPFVGSGTVLYEASRLGIKAYGTEVNPAAVIMSRTFQYANISLDERREILENLECKIKPILKRNIFDMSEQQRDTAAELITLHKKLDRGHCRDILEIVFCRIDLEKKTLDVATMRSIWKELKDFILALPDSPQPIKVALCDARQTTLPDNSVDLVFTSPPYINVFNYHQQYRPSMESLGWDILSVAPSEIGSNRKHRGNRLFTVVQYCIDMASVLKEIKRVCKPTARIILVVGHESNVMKIAFYNSQIIEHLAVKSVGFQILLKQERVFKNKFGKDIYEDILHLSPNISETSDYVDPSEVAISVLEEAKKRVSKKSKIDIETTIAQASKIRTSPLLDVTKIRHQDSLQNAT